MCLDSFRLSTGHLWRSLWRKRLVTDIVAAYDILLPLGKNPLTRTTTFTFPPGFNDDGVIGTLTGVLDLRDGLEAEEAVGVFARVADGAMTVDCSRRRMHSDNTDEYRSCRAIYMKESRGNRLYKWRCSDSAGD